MQFVFWQRFRRDVDLGKAQRPRKIQNDRNRWNPESNKLPCQDQKRAWRGKAPQPAIFEPA
jgi:hypothetical protein